MPSRTVIAPADPGALLSEALPVLTGPVLRIEPWVDPLVDRIGEPVRGEYVERYWLGVLGPTATWLLRRLADELELHPSGVDIELAPLAGSLGLSFAPGQAGPFGRALHRCVIFGLAQPVGRRLAVRRAVPVLSARQVGRLPEAVRMAHEEWVEISRARRAS
jgi:hypothetical protein